MITSKCKKYLLSKPSSWIHNRAVIGFHLQFHKFCNCFINCCLGFSNREKGRYKYAGQWKHSRMHGCGVFEVNERIIYVGSCPVLHYWWLLLRWSLFAFNIFEYIITKFNTKICITVLSYNYDWHSIMIYMHYRVKIYYNVNLKFSLQGRFYFGKHLEDSSGCDEDVSAVYFINFAWFLWRFLRNTL